MSHSQTPDRLAIPAGRGEMAERIRSLDWSKTSLGPTPRWPRSLRTLVDMLLAHPLPMIVLWGPSLIQIYNDGYAGIAGDKHPAALGMPTKECWPEVWDVSAPVYERVLGRGESVLLEDQRFPICRGGATEDAWFTLTYSPVRDDDGRIAGVILTIMETRPKVCVQRQRLEQEANFRTTVERAPFGICAWRGPDLVYEMANAAYHAFAPGKEFLGRSYAETWPEALEPYQSIIRRVMETGEPCYLADVPVRIRRSPDGSLEDGIFDVFYAALPPDVSGQAGVLNIAVETTEHKRVQAALRESEARYRTLFQSIDEGFCIIEVLGGEGEEPIDYRFLEVNPVFERQTGIKNAVGRRMREIAPSHEEQWFEIYGRVARTGEAVRFQNSAGALGRIYDVFAFRMGAPEQRRVAVLFNDITKRKRAEDALRELTETLEQQVAERTAVAEQRARDLRRLAAELNEAEHRERKRLAKLLHDNLQQLLIAARLRLPSVTTADRSEREKHVQRMDELLTECVTTSRNLTRELSPPILQMGTLPEIVEWLGTWSAEKHGLAAVVEVGTGIPPVPEHVRVLVFQAVREMLFNVVKHSGTMEARAGLFAQDGHLVVQVEDEGDGFDPQAFQANLQQPEGFGLFHIRERVEALGGRLQFEATPSGGACFRVILPLFEEDRPQQEASPGRRAGTPRRGPELSVEDTAVRVLVVDDHAVVREGFIGLLEREADLKVVGEAADGEEAVRQAKVLRPHVVLMDVNMPRMDGFEATRRIRAAQPHVVIIGLSFHEDEAVAQAMLEAGADAHISKQTPAREVLQAIRRAVSSSQIA